MPKKIKTTISLIVLNYNGKHLLKAYFDSVLRQTCIPNEIIMLDNASEDTSIQYVRKNYPMVKVICNPTNDGTAGGSNIAATYAKGEFIIFQSNDVELDSHCIRELVNKMQKNNDIGIVTSVLIKDIKTKYIDNAGGVVDKYGFGMQNYPNKKLSEIPYFGSVFFSYGGSFIIRKNIFVKAGGFDARYFTLNDDIDLSWRVRLLGYKVMYTKKSYAYHKISATLGPLFNQTFKRYLSERNSLCTLLKNYSYVNILIHLPQYIILLFGEIGFFAMLGRFDLACADIRALLWNIKHIDKTIKKRKIIQAIRRVPDNELPFENNSLKLKLFIDFNKAL